MNRQLVLVPQGAEYRAVQRGLRGQRLRGWQVVPLRAGAAALSTPALSAALANGPTVAVVLGVCGGLQPQDPVGEVVVYRTCQDEAGAMASLDGLLLARFGDRWRFVKAITTQGVMCKAKEKQALARRWGVEVVDMEGVLLLRHLQGLGIPVAMVRVISDGGDRDLPDLTHAVDHLGNLRPWPLMVAMLRNPLAAAYLVQGSLRALAVLEAIAPEVVRCLADSTPAPLP
ncbi:phosphorylase family protein [Parathermosynechococcus lividus]